MLTDAMATLLPSHATCLLFVGAARHPSFVVERCKVPFRELGASEVLLRVRLAGLCASDIRRFVSEDGECALIPGHEAVGDVIASRRPGVDVGSRVVFSSSNWCLKCKWCRRGDHVACEDITKYGQPPLAAPSSSEGLGGALSSLVLLRVGTAVCDVPTAVPDRHAILASCALATALAGLLRLTASSRRRDDQDAPSVLVQGCGLVGILSCAVLVQSGYRVFCEDGDLSRLRIAAKFHAQPIFKETGPLTPSSTLPERLDAVVLAFGGSLESNGGPRAKPTSLLQGQAGLLRPGGTLLLLGQPSDTKNTYSAILEAGTILEKGFCVIGASEYQPENLKDAVQFLEATEGKFPYDELLSPVYGMLDFQSALTSALDGRFLRVLVRPSC